MVDAGPEPTYAEKKLECPPARAYVCRKKLECPPGVECRQSLVSFNPNNHI